MTSTGSQFTRWVFSRHSHPWSAWTRWASTPLVMLPIWNRSPRQGAVLGVWLMLNPVLFPPPGDDSAFATRAVLGEERWLRERPISGALAINCMASGALLVAIDGARRHRRSQMTVATIGTMGALLWYWREMVRFYATERPARQSVASELLERRTMASGAPSAAAGCLVAYDDDGNAVAAVTVKPYLAWCGIA